MDRESKNSSQQPGSAAAVLSLAMVLSGPSRYRRVRLELDSLRFESKSGALEMSLGDRGVKLAPDSKRGAELKIPAPVGSWSGVQLRISRVHGQTTNGRWRRIGSSVSLISPKPVEIGAGSIARVEFAPTVKDLQRPTSLPPASDAGRWHLVAGRSAETVRLTRPSLSGGVDLAALRLRPESFVPGTVIRVLPRGPGGLPALFRGQRALGPVVEITASTAPRALFELGITWNPADQAAALIRPQDIVVLQLTADRSQYRELRPHRVDPTTHTVYVRARALSHFFACTPGIEIHRPEHVIDAAGEVVAYPADERALVTGRVLDERAVVTLPTLVHGQSWVTQGWFLFEAVQLGPSDTLVTVRAEVDGLVTHSCELVVRRALMKKTVVRPAPWFAGTAALGDDGTPFVASALAQPVTLAGVEGVDRIQAAFRAIDRNIPTVFWFDTPSDNWQSLELVPRWLQEEEVARLAIPQIRQYTDYDPPVNPAYPEEVRHLRSLADFFEGIQGDPNSVGPAIIAGIASNAFRSRYLTVSPRVPVVSRGAREVGAGFVVATAQGHLSLTRIALGRLISRFHVPRRLESSVDFGVRAGRLFFARVAPGGVLSRETVADDIVCGPVSLRVDPVTNEPTLLAIQIPDDPGGSFFLGRLCLFARQADGQWVRDIVWEGDRIVEADFAFDLTGRPHIVAAVSSGDDLNGVLHYLTRDPAGAWSRALLEWVDADSGTRSTTGMFPRVTVDDQQRPCCAFTLFEQDAVTWMVAQLDGGAWRARMFGRGVRDDLTGVADAAAPRDFPDDVVGRSRVSAHHWAPSIAAGAPGALWCAWGAGVLHLTEVPTSLDTATDRIVDLDRTTGFLTQLAVRPTGAPIIAYKDVHGSERFDPLAETLLATGADVHLFDLGQSHQVSRPQAFPPLVPRRRIARGNVAGFGTRLPFTCGVLTDFVNLVVLSTLSDIFGGEGGATPGEQRDLQDRIQASLMLNERIDITARPQQSLVEIALINRNPTEADAIESLRITRRGNQPATLIATTVAGASGDGVCGISQDGWNGIADQFLNLPLDPASLFPSPPGIRIDLIEVRDIGISFTTDTSPTPQQGGVRFRIAVQSIRAQGERDGVGFTATSRAATVLEFVLSPFVVDGQVQWFTRSVNGRIADFDVDVDLEFVTWIGIVATFLTGMPLFLALALVDPVVGTIAADQANDQIAAREGVPLGGIPGTLRDLLGAHALRQAFGVNVDFGGAEFEAVDLTDFDIRYHLRAPRTDPAPRLGISVAPSPIRVGAAHIGEESVDRVCLVENPGDLPVSLDSITVVGTQDFVVSGLTLPRILPSGHAELFRVRLRPTGSAGDRAARLRFGFNLHETFEVELFGIAFPPLEPEIEVLPRLLQFGVVTVGGSATLGLHIRNQGQAPLLISEMRLEGPDSALFSLAVPAPLNVAAGGSVILLVSFTPAAMVSGGQRATLVLVSDARNEPNLQVPLSGSGAAGDLLIQPTQLAFSDGLVGFPIGSRRPFTVYNIGAVGITLAASSFVPIDVQSGQPSRDFTIVDATGQPVAALDRTLPAGAFLALASEFRPAAPGIHAAELTFVSTDGAQGPVVVSMRGNGVV